jgi:hypothetical protein
MNNHHDPEDRDRVVVAARTLDETVVLHVDELCARLHVERHWIVELVELGALEPRAGREPATWGFLAAEVPRLRAITRLVEDLGVNLAGAALIVELVEERRRLLQQLRQWREARD